MEYSINDPKGIVRTKNFWMNYQGNLQELKCKCLPLRNSRFCGFEDVRLFYYNETPYGIATLFEYGENNHPSQVLLKINEDLCEIEAVKALQYKTNICQKNWCPFVQNGKAYIIYSHYPLTILELDMDMSRNDKMKVIVDKEPKYDFSRIRGSSSPIVIGGDFFILVHEVIFNPRKYYHRFLRYGQNWELKGISQPFYFRRLGIEFSLCILYIEEQESIRIYYSVMDGSTESLDVKVSDIVWMGDF